MADQNRATSGATEPSSEERIVKTATEARAGKIVLGKYAHLIWIASVAVIVILALVFWAL